MADMTLHDFFCLICRKIVFVIVIPLVCVVIAVANCLMSPGNYIVETGYIYGGDLSLMLGFAEAAADEQSNEELKVFISSYSNENKVNVSSQGTSPDACIEAVNSVIDSTVDEYKAADASSILVPIYADSFIDESPSVIKTALYGLIVGLVLALCLLFLLDKVKAPIKSKDDIERISKLPVLGVLPSQDAGERLLANTQFRCGALPKSIALIPVGPDDAQRIVLADFLCAFENVAVAAKGIRGSAHARKFGATIPEKSAVVVSCDSLSAGMGAVFIARDVQAVVLCVQQWSTTAKDLIQALDDLKLAAVEITGIAFVGTDGRIGRARK